jgi:sugar lactone lactonase YvrE
MKQTTSRDRHNFKRRGVRVFRVLSTALLALTTVTLPAQIYSTLKLTSGLSDGTVGQPYARNVLVSGGSAPYNFETSGTSPTGLAWVPVHAGLLLTGTPSEPGIYSFSVRVTDANGQHSSESLSMTVTASHARPHATSPSNTAIAEQIIEGDTDTVTITDVIQPTGLPSGTAGTPYPPVTFTVPGSGNTFGESGSLPKGMTATPGNNDLVLSGTPIQSGSFGFTISVTTQAGQTVKQLYILNVAPGPPVVISPATIPSPVVDGGNFGPIFFSTSGGASALTLSESGALPAGLTLSYNNSNNNLEMFGYPTQIGTFPFSILATDQLGASVSQSYSLTVTPAPPPAVYPATILSSILVGTVYPSTNFQISGGSGYGSVALTGGSVPPGMTFACVLTTCPGAIGVLSGTPTVPGTYIFTITATDAHIANSSASQTYTIVVDPLPAATIVVSTSPDAVPLYTDQITLNFKATGNYPNVPTGKITVTVDGTSAATLAGGVGSLEAPLVNGIATIKIGRLAPGTHTVIYTYSGDSQYPGTSGTAFHTFTVSYPLHYLTGTSVTVLPASGDADTYYDAVDSDDNVYLSDYTNSVIHKYDTSGNLTTVPTTGLKHPSAMVFDGNGNLYIADTGNGRIVELTPGGTQTVVPTGTLSFPSALAFDPVGQNLWIADAGKRVLQFNLPSQSVNAGNTLTRLGGPPASLAVGLDGTVYAGTGGVDSDCGGLYTFAPGVTTATVVTYPQICSVNGLIVDRSGNLYLEDSYYGSLYRLDASGNLIQFAQGITANIAMDSQGAVWLANADGSLGEFVPGPAGYAGVTPSSEGVHNGSGSVTFGGTFELYFHFPTNTSVATLGWPTNSAYAFPSEGYNESGFFFTDLYRAPLNPGLQKESFSVTFTDGTVLTVPLYGSAYNTELGISPGVVSAVSTNIGYKVTTFGGVALGKDSLDQRSFVYYSDTAANQVYFTDYAGALNSSNTAYNSLGFTGLNAPTQVAADGTQAVYVLDSGGSRIVKLDSSGVQTVVFDLSAQSALSSLTAFALDGATNLYLAGTNSKGKAQIVKMPAQGGYTIFNANLAAVPTALAVDGNSLLTSGDGTGAVIQYNRFGVANNLANVGAAITSMTIEPSGTIYATTTGSATLSAISPQGVVTSHSIAGVTSAAAVAEDGAGTITVADAGSGYLFTEVRDPYVLYNPGSQIPGTIFNFPATAIESSSPVQNYTLTNIGTTQSYTLTNGGATLVEDANSGLTLENLPSLTDFPQAAPSTCVAGTTNLVAGASCVLAYSFRPPSIGPDSEVDGLFYSTPHYSTFPTLLDATFTGTGVSNLPAISFSSTSLQFGRVGLGQTSTETLTVNNTGGGTLHLSSISIDNGHYTYTSTCGSSLAAFTGTCTINVVFTAATLGSDPGTLTLTDDTGGVSGSSQQISLSGTGIAGTKPFVFVANGAGSVSALYSNGYVLSNAVAGGGIGAAVDRNGQVFSIKADGSGVSSFSDSGMAGPFPISAPTGSSALAIDGQDRLWIAAPGAVRVGSILTYFNSVTNLADSTLVKPSGVAIDISGNVWISDSQSDSVHEIVGGAAPVLPLANAVQTNSLGVEP